MGLNDTVRAVLDHKGFGVCAVAPETPVYEALELMADRDIGALLVMMEAELQGVFSERDYARKVILKGKTSKETPVREIMSTEVVCVAPERTVEECMGLMTDKRIRHLPVLESDRVVGVISIGDVVKAIIAEHEFTIEQLQSYITRG